MRRTIALFVAFYPPPNGGSKFLFDDGLVWMLSWDNEKPVNADDLE
jgi:hypothetical protein